jgi:hypothetical protein
MSGLKTRAGVGPGIVRGLDHPNSSIFKGNNPSPGLKISNSHSSTTSFNNFQRPFVLDTTAVVVTIPAVPTPASSVLLETLLALL